jgi:hypothetical protein
MNGQWRTIDTAPRAKNVRPAMPQMPAWMSIPLPLTGGCRFPMWNDKERATLEYCGAERQDDSSYCPKHHKRTHVKASNKRL